MTNNIIPMPLTEAVLREGVEARITEMAELGYVPHSWCEGFENENMSEHEAAINFQLPTVAMHCLARSVDLLDNWFLAQPGEPWLPKDGVFKRVAGDLGTLFETQALHYPVYTELMLNFEGCAGEDHLVTVHSVALRMYTQLDSDEVLDRGETSNVRRLKKMLYYVTLLVGVLRLDPLRRMFTIEADMRQSVAKETLLN